VEHLVGRSHVFYTAQPRISYIEQENAVLVATVAPQHNRFFALAVRTFVAENRFGVERRMIDGRRSCGPTASSSFGRPSY